MTGVTNRDKMQLGRKERNPLQTGFSVVLRLKERWGGERSKIVKINVFSYIFSWEGFVALCPGIIVEKFKKKELFTAKRGDLNQQWSQSQTKKVGRQYNIRVFWFTCHSSVEEEESL